MERSFETIRNVEDIALGRARISDFLGSLNPLELEIVWFRTDNSVTDREIAERLEISPSQFDTLLMRIMVKAEAYLK